MTLIRFNIPEVGSLRAFGRLPSLRQELDRLFESPWADFAQAARYVTAGTPAVDLYENPDAYVVTAEVPGVKAADIQVAVEDNILTISGERKSDEASDERVLHRCERFEGKFERRVQLAKPVDASQVKAAYRDGVLTITLPKSEAAKPKQIQIAVN